MEVVGTEVTFTTADLIQMFRPLFPELRERLNAIRDEGKSPSAIILPRLSLYGIPIQLVSKEGATCTT